ncbi:MAG: DDE transposase [Bacteroidota bacterium]
MAQKVFKVGQGFIIRTMANLLFSHQQLLHEKFLQTDLGELYVAIPFEQLAATVAAPDGSKSGLGRKSWFDVKGGIGLLVLKHYLQLSDDLLIQRINTDWSMQLFCGILLRPEQRIRDTNLPSWWRTYIGKRLDIDAMQTALAKYWKPFMEQTGIGMQDATCYESRISYPTDVKLIWNCCQQVYLFIQHRRKELKLRKSRMNYPRQKENFQSYQKTRKKTKRAEKKLRKKLLKFLLKLLQRLDDLQQKHHFALSNKDQGKLRTIIKVYEQHHRKLYGDNNEIKDRIVSLSKPYIRPIVRGKETKAVEFGAKVNVLQIDGINFIEHLSYDAFNEGTRLQSGIYLQRKLFGKCTHQSADQIYATNANRTYCRQNNIATNFIPKGKQKILHIEQSAVLRKTLNIGRATILEGSFGNEKCHYYLQKIPARNQITETCWIFFGIFTSNAVRIADRIAASRQTARAA